jgi:hypothetical protein
MKTLQNTRPLNIIADEIYHDWRNVNYAAKPYLSAMASLSSLDELFMYDPAKDVVARFLCNAATWRGETAKRIKTELRTALKRARK